MHTRSQQNTLQAIFAVMVAFLAFASTSVYAVNKINKVKSNEPESAETKVKKQDNNKTSETTQPKFEKKPIVQWSSDINKHPINNLKECQLRSKIQTMPDGASKIRVVFVFNSKHLFVLTDGNIDTEYKNTGITIYGDKPSKRYGFNQISRKTNVVFPNFTRKHINEILAAKSIRVTLGFWPTWPTTKTTTTTVSLYGFAKVYQEFLLCVNN